MRTIAATGLCLILLTMTGTARAEGMNNLYAAINGLVYFPADPIVFTISPPEDYEELPWHQVTSRIVGLPTGILMAGYRVFTAAADLAFFPFWVFQVFSPEPPWTLIPDVEYE